jgi:hypothetical protein
MVQFLKKDEGSRGAMPVLHLPSITLTLNREQ